MVEAAVALVVSSPGAASTVFTSAEELCSRFLTYIPFAAIAMTITAAAKIELFTYLVCQAMQPVVNPDQGSPSDEDPGIILASHLMSVLSAGKHPRGVCVVSLCGDVLR